MGAMKRLAVLFLFVAACFAQAGTSAKQLTGIWQCTHEIAAGWNECCRFFPDGKLIWDANQMDDGKRLIERRGTWTLKGDSLRIVLTSETALVGGRKGKEDEYGDGESMWIGAKTVNRKMSKPVVKTMTLGKVAKRDGYPSTLLFGRRFWQMKTDPKDYQ
jgi:hypothetical protein